MKFKYPKKQGLYDPQFEHDSCGVGFIVQIKNKKSHQIVEQGLSLLCNLDHRGALGADPDSGDGSGIMIQIPHQFFLAYLLTKKELQQMQAMILVHTYSKPMDNQETFLD